MSQELCARFMQDLEKRDVDAIRPWFINESVLWMPPSEPVQGDRRILTMFRLIFKKYSDLHWKIGPVYHADGTRYIYMTDSWGTIGKQTPYKNSILTIIEFNADGKIIFLSDYFKDTAIFGAEKPAPIPAAGQ